MYVANCSLKYNPDDFTVVNRVLTLAGNTELVGDPFIAHHCGGLLLDGGVFDEKKVEGKYVVTLVGETPVDYMKAKCSLLCDSAKFEMVDGALSLKAVEPSGFDITWDGDTTGLESFVDQAYKVASSVEGIDAESVIGATMVYAGYSSEVTADKITPSGDNVLMISDEDIGGTVIVVSEDSTLMDMPITKGVWFFKSATDENNYVSRLYKE